MGGCGPVLCPQVNISNTWVLPEDGFPVFYRYFRDRINWFEADAVCQFHHANLVTVDTGAQFDAARAFLKELDVLSPVWVGLKRGRAQPHFLWTNEQPLSSVGYWNEALPGSGAEELCAAADPAADFRWHGLSCGGLEVAAFICELPVPDWAAARDGCMVENLPSLTAAFLPEEAAIELTSDCGLGGTRRVVCRGNTTREKLVAQLGCHDMMNEDAALGPGSGSGAGPGAPPAEQEQAEAAEADADDAYTSTSTGEYAGACGETSASTSGGASAEVTSPRQRRATTSISSTTVRDSTTDVSVDTSVPVSAAQRRAAPSRASSTEPSSSEQPSTAAEVVTQSPAAAAPKSTAAPAGDRRPDTLIVARTDEQRSKAATPAPPKDAVGSSRA
ncbi:hypothetical protein ONE63_010620 [Megalurothrips usitatus]|uniref:C-type lectin domain-containing protein n=1 Tax=Megalurothrips usitatus TaxID=439358 RepID=A0AAV7XDG8_9NEOP|nr:hypothetical protein ONE63_010620 [Megalurothrips usitatus]